MRGVSPMDDPRHGRSYRHAGAQAAARQPFVCRSRSAFRPEYGHRYRLRDDRGRPLVDHGTIRLFELSKSDVEPVQRDAERWLKFLKDGASLDPARLPAWMQSPIMRSAMSTLNAFSEKERDYHRYQSRQEALRVQRAVAQELEERRAAEQTALQAMEVERQAKEAALAEIARLKALLERQTKG